MKLAKRIALIVFVVLIVALAALESAGRNAYRQATWEKAPVCSDAETVTLRDGRRLAFRRAGVPAGEPAFFFHGALGSRLEWPSDEAARRAGLSVIAIDRPGYGCSDPQQGRTLAGWVEDVEELAAALRIRRFRVFGWSTGGLHALAVARAFPGRVVAADVLSTAAPPERFQQKLLLGMVRFAPGLTWWTLARYREQWNEDEGRKPLPPLERAEAAAADGPLRATHKEAFRASATGLMEDFLILSREWPVEYERIDAPVRFWHGSDDSLAPVDGAKAIAARVPRARFTELPGEGHFLLYRHQSAILSR